jgi:NADH-quinone oxidoreductase subunit N
MVEKEGEVATIESFAGLGASRTGLALAMTLFMLSLTGLPPTIGFIGKYYVFSAVISANYLWLAIVGVITSVISAFYYLRIVMVMWMRPGEATVTTSPTSNAVVSLAAIATFVVGIFPGPFISMAERAVLAFFRA